MTWRPTINGYNVIAFFQIKPVSPTSEPRRIVVVDRGLDRKHDRYVVASHTGQYDEWDSGDYCDTIMQALDSYAARIRRNL
jgi:hypothetical protein